MGGKVLRFRRIVEKEQDQHQADDAAQCRAEEAPLPAEGRDNRAHEDEGKPLADIVGGAEDAVIGSPYLQGHPTGERHDTGRRSHALRPSVHGPEDAEARKQHSVGNLSVLGAYTEDAHDEVHADGDDDPCGHEPPDVGPVGQEAVYKLTYGISPVQTGADDTELGGRQKPRVDQRLLHHAHRQAADVVQGISQGSSDERLHPVPFV